MISPFLAWEDCFLFEFQRRNNPPVWPWGEAKPKDCQRFWKWCMERRKLEDWVPEVNLEVWKREAKFALPMLRFGTDLCHSGQSKSLELSLVPRFPICIWVLTCFFFSLETGQRKQCFFDSHPLAWEHRSPHIPDHPWFEKKTISVRSWSKLWILTYTFGYFWPMRFLKVLDRCYSTLFHISLIVLNVCWSEKDFTISFELCWATNQVSKNLINSEFIAQRHQITHRETFELIVSLDFGSRFWCWISSSWSHAQW